MPTCPWGVVSSVGSQFRLAEGWGLFREEFAHDEGFAISEEVDMNDLRPADQVDSFSRSTAPLVLAVTSGAPCTEIIRTGHCAIRKKRSATLPSTSRRTPRRPCVPITTRSA